TEAATQHALPRLVDLEVTKLAERLDAVPGLIAGETAKFGSRIEAVRQSSEQLVQKAQAGAVQAAQGELREIESRIQGVLKDAQTAMRAANPTSEIQHLRSDM